MNQADDDPVDEIADEHDPDPTHKVEKLGAQAPAGEHATSLPGDPELFRGHEPLGDADPTRVGDFWLDSRVAATPAGVAYTAHEEGGDAVLLILLGEGAAEDPAARARFSGEINAMHIDTVVARGGQDQDSGRLRVRFRPEGDDPSLAHLPPRAPWAALAFDGTRPAVAEALRVLHAVDLHTAPPLSTPSGPDYRLHWIDRTRAGTTRAWPLGWPGRRDRAGWISILISWLIMLLLAALGLLLAILAFQNAPLVSPPPPVPSEASGSGEGGSGSPQSGSPSEGGGGATPDDSFTPTMGEPSEDGSDGGSDPSVNPRL